MLSRPISINNIRASRKPPGLRFQHAAGERTSYSPLHLDTNASAPGLRLVAEICSARLDGCDPGSPSIDFYPQSKPRLSQSYSADPGTAGSIALLLQVSLPCLLFSPSAADPSTLVLRGGTNATQSPQIDYTQHVFLPFLRTHFRLDPQLQIVKRGYYPKGGGEVHLSIPPVTTPIPPVTLTARGKVNFVHGRSYVAGLPKNLADSMRAAAVTVLEEFGIDKKHIKIESVREKPADAIASGSGIVLWAETGDGCIIGGSAIGRKGTDPPSVGRSAAHELTTNLAHGGCVDEYMQVRPSFFPSAAIRTEQPIARIK